MGRNRHLFAVLAAVAVALSATRADSAERYTITGKIDGPDGGWDYAAYDAASHKLYVSRTDGVMAVDTTTNTVTAQLVRGSKARAVVVIPTLRRLLVTFAGDNATTIFDTANTRVVATLPTPGPPDGAVLDEATGKIYVMGKNGEILIVDPAAARIEGHITVGGELEAPAVDGHGKLFVNVADKTEIAAVDLKSQRVSARYHLTGCKGPTGLAYIPGGHRLLAACDNGMAAVVDAASGKQLASLKVGAAPDAVIYDARRELAFIPAGEAGTLAIIDLHGPLAALRETLPTHFSAATGAVDIESGRLFLPTAEFQMNPPPEQRGDHLRGTFRVLIVGPN